MRAARYVGAGLGCLLGVSLLFAGSPNPGPAPKVPPSRSAPLRTPHTKSAQPKQDAGSSKGQTPAEAQGKPEVVKSEEKKCPYPTQDCLNMMARRMKASGWIGIEYEPKDPDGPKVTQVVPGSPAEKAGLQPGDVLFALNGVELRGGDESALEKARKDWKPGQTVQYTLKRAGAMKQVDVVLGEWPADILARYIGEHMLQHAQWDAEAAAKQPPPKK